MLPVLLAAALLSPNANPRQSFAIYAFAASADEIMSVGMVERGLVKSQRGRIALKAALLPAYVAVTCKAGQSDHRWVRRVGAVGRWIIPAGFVAGAIHNVRQR